MKPNPAIFIWFGFCCFFFLLVFFLVFLPALPVFPLLCPLFSLPSPSLFLPIPVHSPFPCPSLLVSLPFLPNFFFLISPYFWKAPTSFFSFSFSSSPLGSLSSSCLSPSFPFSSSDFLFPVYFLRSLPLSLLTLSVSVRLSFILSLLCYPLLSQQEHYISRV